MSLGVVPQYQFCRSVILSVSEESIRNYYVYIITNWNNKVLYIGVTSNLTRRMAEHRSGQISGFSSKYRLKKLVYFEEFNEINDALVSEKKLKGWLRQKKIDLITKKNPDWIDLDSSA